MTKRIWINFKELRTKLRFDEVLAHFKVEVRRKGEQHQGFCPLPGHTGKRSSPSFSANLDRGIFQCFGCGERGNVLEFACLMSGVDPKDGDALRSVAAELQAKFFDEKKSDGREPPSEDRRTSDALPVVVNAPLDFDLKGLDHVHPYLERRGFTPATMAHFGVGHCSRGFLKDRIAIPLHDSAGKLLGYAGRVIDDALINEDNPRYRFPSRRERGGRIYDFKKSLFLYNGFRIVSPCDDLAVVEGFPSVWWLNQCGIPWVVALMGSDCSEIQVELIISMVKPSGRVWLIPDGDKAGDRWAQVCLPMIARERFVRRLDLPEGKQPTDLTPAELKSSLALAS